jgi:hypothetical protein
VPGLCCFRTDRFPAERIGVIPKGLFAADFFLKLGIYFHAQGFGLT